jgi:hypothetical protein
MSLNWRKSEIIVVPLLKPQYLVPTKESPSMYKNPANYVSVIWQACIHNNDIEKVADSTTKISITLYMTGASTIELSTNKV